MNISNILSLLSGVALFLFGMTLMGDSLKKVAGNKLEVFLYKLSSTPLKGILLGAGVTSVIQSSSATSIMTVGFVNSRMMKVKQAIGIIMGAIIGTSITGWIISLSSINMGSKGILELISTESLTAIIAIIGIILRMFSKHTKKRHIGEILLGFAVLMFGMQTMSASVEGLRESPVFISVLSTLSNPIIGILFGAVFTAVIQSASAAVGILQALSSTGAITFSDSLPIIMGIAIGASLPVILSALGASRDGKKTAWSYLVIDIIGAVIFSIIFYSLNAVFHFSFINMTMNTFSIALQNTAFRVLIIILLAPFISLIEKITNLIVKNDDEEEDTQNDIDRLEDRFIAHPALAIEQSRLAINSMADLTRDNVYLACSLLKNYNDKTFKKVQNKEELSDRYEDKLGSYLVRVNRKELSKSLNKNASKFLHTITDFERISDHCLNIAEASKNIQENKTAFSKDASYEIDNLSVAVQDLVSIATTAFVNEDLSLAYNVEPFEQLIDDICLKMKSNHYDRIEKGECTLEHGFVFNDLLTDFERIADHCSNIALAMIELDNNTFDTHKYEEEINKSHQHNYDEMYKQYTEKYGLK